MHVSVAKRCYSASSSSLARQTRHYAKPAVDVLAGRLEQLADKVIDGASASVIEEVGGRKRVRIRQLQKKTLGSPVVFESGKPPPMDGALTAVGVDSTVTWDESKSAFDVKPGDYVELGVPGAGVPLNGVIVGQIYQTRKLFLLSFTNKGEIVTHGEDLVRFTIPGLISTDLAIRCGSGYHTANEHEQQARVRVLRYLNQLAPTIELTAHMANSELKHAYKLLCSKDPDKDALTSISLLTRMFRRKPTFIDLIAVHRFVNTNGDKFHPARDYAISQSVIVRSQNSCKRINAVEKWRLESPSPIDAFIEKALPIIEKSRVLRSTTFWEPASIVSGGHHWNDDDKVILQFLVDAVLSVNQEFPEPFIAGENRIVKELYPDIARVDHSEVMEALVDLGVIPPWQDLTLEVEDIPEREVQRIVERYFEQMANRPKFLSAAIANPLSQPLGEEDFYPFDPQESVRHDWGKLPVYMVDDSSAKELDDGISVERISGEPDNFWVHVHVADPASFIPPTHTFAVEAEKRLLSRYHPFKDECMLPPGITTRNNLPGMSLGNQEPQRVLTFSSKINLNGDLLAHDVKSGFIHNILKASYDTLDQEQGLGATQLTYPFGSPLPRDIHPVNLTRQNREDLKLLDDIRNAFVKRRLQDGVFGTSETLAEVVTLSKPPESHGIALDGRLHTGFLDMTWKVQELEKYDVGARNMVAEMMKLAGRVASIWCKERNIPGLRRVLPQPPHYQGMDIERLLATRSANGYVRRIEAIPYLDYDMKSTYSLDVGPHWSVGVPAEDGYMRATSPLRRFIDLQTHWQILHYLRGNKRPLFTKEVLASKAELMGSRDRWEKREEGRNRIMWQSLFLDRWMANENAQKRAEFGDPVQEMKGLVMNIPQRHNRMQCYVAPVHISALGIRATIVNLDSMREVTMGQTVRVKEITTVKGYHPAIWVKLVR